MQRRRRWHYYPAVDSTCTLLLDRRVAWLPYLAVRRGPSHHDWLSSRSEHEGKQNRAGHGAFSSPDSHLPTRIQSPDGLPPSPDNNENAEPATELSSHLTQVFRREYSQRQMIPSSPTDRVATRSRHDLGSQDLCPRQGHHREEKSPGHVDPDCTLQGLTFPLATW